MILLGLEWLGTALNLLGGVYIARKQVTGFWIVTFADILLCIYCLLTAQFGMLLMFLAWIVVNIYGIYYWGKE
jgi:hypothetical protein